MQCGVQHRAPSVPAAESLSLCIAVTEGEASIDTTTPRPWGGATPAQVTPPGASGWIISFT